ncbi:exodeoxyribonuclease VII large subunit [Paeniglutamicibacter gangotriensis]|uniref:exodeoxyribonuclease VII large subunit n=1 Tax=Paeniglutamicibacter gangotriensis TaxID=254787 RepID=UPI0037C9585A
MRTPPDVPVETISARSLSKRIQTSITGKTYAITGECKDAHQRPDSSWDFDLVTKDEHTESVSYIPCRIWPEQQQSINAEFLQSGPPLAKALTDGIGLTVLGETRMWNNRLQFKTLAISSEFVRNGRLYCDQEAALKRLKDRHPELARLSIDPAKVHLPSYEGVPVPNASFQRVLVIAPEHGQGTNDFKRQMKRHPSQPSRITYRSITWSQKKAPGRLGSLIRLAHQDGYGMIVLLRGGGHWSELEVFDTEILAELIAASEVPVITALGHNDDVFLADRVALASYVAPSAAASAITKSLDRQFSAELKTKSQQKAEKSLALSQKVTQDLSDARAELSAAKAQSLDLSREVATQYDHQQQVLAQMAHRRVRAWSRLATGIVAAIAISLTLGAPQVLEFFGVEPTFRAVLVTWSVTIAAAWILTWRLDVARQRSHLPAARPMRKPPSSSEWLDEIRRVRSIHRFRKLQRHSPRRIFGSET